MGDDIQLGAVGGAKRVKVDIPANTNCKLEKKATGTAPDTPRTGTTSSGKHDGASASKGEGGRISKRYILRTLFDRHEGVLRRKALQG